MQDSNRWCFACGPDNPIGLKLQFREENGVYSTTFTPQAEHQGYDGVVHGGIVSTLLDEIMARYIYAQGHTAVTARLEIRYHQPTPIARELTITSRIVGCRSNIYELTGEIKLPDGTVTATGKSKIAVTGTIGAEKNEIKTV